MEHKGLVQWREWGGPAFAEAKAFGKLVLLDISAVWCHWCHVMDETSYSDPLVAEMINKRFVPVRVDTDRMPDVNERYNMGGWPTTAVLTHTGEVLLGATYVPPEKLKETLASLADFYDENREAVGRKIEEIVRKKAEERRQAEAPGEDMGGNVVAYVLEEIDRNYDLVHGGFGTGPKFPAPEALELLMAAYADTGKKSCLEMVERTLEGMAARGMYDHVMGGFFRYSVTRDWTVPHFEKMLDVNAGLLAAYINAWKLTGRDAYLETAKSTIGYVDSWLFSEGGYFAGSQDADEGYYSLPLEGRRIKGAPYVDRTMFTNLNARMALSYLLAWEALRREECRDRALSALGFALRHMKGEGGGFYHYYADGRAHRYGLLTDQSAMFRALLFAYQTTSDGKWLDEALSVLGYMEKALWDEERGGFFDLPEDPDAVAALSLRGKPMQDDAEMARSLLALSALTGDSRRAETARRCLLPHARSYREYSYMASGYALAVDMLVKGATGLTLEGDAAGVHDLYDAVRGTYVPRLVVHMKPSHGPAAAYVCRASVCTARIEDRASLKEELKKAA